MTTTTRHPIPIRTSPALVRLVNAPGFTPARFTAALARARQRTIARLDPLGGGKVRAEFGGSDAHVVTRTWCTCRGHQSHGYCLHRAVAIWADAMGIDLRHETVLGFDESGRLVTAAQREGALAAA